MTRSIIEELHSSDKQRDQMEGGSGLTRSIIDELQSKMEGESGVTRSIINGLHSWDIQ